MPRVEARKLRESCTNMFKLHFGGSVYNLMDREGFVNDRALNPCPSQCFSNCILPRYPSFQVKYVDCKKNRFISSSQVC